MKVHELISKLQQMPKDADVKVWLPGTYIRPSNVFPGPAVSPEVLIEGDVITSQGIPAVDD